MKKLIIAVNLGKVRILKYRAAGEDPIEQEHLVEEPEASSEAHVDTIQEVVTDQAGRFGRGGPAGVQAGMSYGEGHNLALELERGALKELATRIERVLEAEVYPAWLLAAPQSILARLQKELSARARDRLSSTVGADLTREPLAQMEGRFL